MAKVSVYLNFNRQVEEAFEFYKKVFRTEYIGHVARFRDIPPSESMPPLSDDDKNLVMHVSLPVMGDFVLMGCDAPESMGFTVNKGNNVHLNLEPDTRTEADRLFAELSAGGQVTMPMADMFWGAYYGSLTDKFGINWMINFSHQG